jgi:CRISPR-associated protein Cas7/Cst2/DevR subtype I-B
MSFLSHAQLGNHNAGEGGRQLSDLKMHGSRPYISGQAFRHAARDALRGSTEDGVDCSPQDSCGNIDECKVCDLFGYFNTDLDEHSKRVSPLRVSKLLGQKDSPVTTDMLLQYAVEEEDGSRDNKIAYRELTENVYRGSWMVDVDAIGRREIEQFDGDEDAGARYTRKFEDYLSDDERDERIEELVRALQNACLLAGQARHMADFQPDIAVAATSDTYQQRVANALHFDDEETLSTDAFESVLRDLTSYGDVWVGVNHNPDVVRNWDAIVGTAEDVDDAEVYNGVTPCYDRLIEAAQSGTGGVIGD